LAGLEILDQELSAEIDFNPGPFITFDSLILINKNKVKTAFLAAFLNVKLNSPYDQRKINRIPSLIDPLPYLSINKVPELHFANEKCEILLDLTDEKASAFDGIVGFLPNQSEPGKILITGQVYLKIENLFRSGKRLELDWKKIDVQSQELGISYNHPAIFRFPLDFGISFDLYKQDTSFLTRYFNLNFLFNNYKGGQLGVNYQNISSRLLGIPEIPDSVNLLIADYNLNYYGLFYNYNSLDHPIFPSKGWKIEINGDIGYKNVIKNSAIDHEYYANILPKSLQWQSTLSTDKYFSLAPRNVLVAKLSAGYMQSDQLFLNDLFRLGGINSIRGFNEKFFYASKYIIGTLEYHYLFENESQLIAFFDGSSLGFDVNDQTYRDQPFGVGAGISLSTRAGLLNVIFAMGKSNKQPFGFKYSKIHVGYTNRF
jgi:outer membrane protein assembly factor BamA